MGTIPPLDTTIAPLPSLEALLQAASLPAPASVSLSDSIHSMLKPDPSAFTTAESTQASSTTSLATTAEKAEDVVQRIVATHTTPPKTYEVTADKNGWISLQLTPGAKKQANIIYMWRRKSDKKVLIGMTETTCAKRVSGYLYCMNHPEKKKGKLALPQAVRENPTDFEFGILCKSPDDVDLGALESAYIKMKNAMTHGFNKRNGGGGARARKKKPTAEQIENARKEVFANFQSPPKKGIKKTAKGYQVELSPKTKKLKNVVYVFKNNVTGERYVGKTIRTLSKRSSEHCHHAAHENNDEGKAPLYNAIRADHKAISVGVLCQLEEGKESLIDAMEKAFIDHYDSYHNGYNQNGGGGGS